MNYFSRPRTAETILVAFLAAAAATLSILYLWQRSWEPTHYQADKACGTDNLASQIPRARFLAIVGDGVPGNSIVVDRPYNTQFSQGVDLYEGVELALRRYKDREDLEVRYFDDGGNPTCAERIARALSNEPGLLAVIGHSTTSCTKAALPHYDTANVPLLIPAATNPDLLSQFSRAAFRLPSNDQVQSVVLADMIANKMQAAKVVLVWDETPEAAQYARYIQRAVQYLLNTRALLEAPKTASGKNEQSPEDGIDPGAATASERPIPRIEGSYPISLNPLNYSYLFRRIVSSEPDVVLFAGYGSLAREFLFGLDDEYDRHPDRTRPKILLTDGCKIAGLKSYDFDALLTFPAEPLELLAPLKELSSRAPTGDTAATYLNESYEVFGYDAATMLITAITTLESRGRGVSRKQLRDLLASQTPPTAYTYSFRQGENTRHRYFVYSLLENKIAETYDEADINHLLTLVKLP